MAKVDATEETELAEKYEIRGYPTLKFFRDGKIMEYSGGRVAEDIIKWLKKKTGPPAQTLSNAEEAKAFKGSSDVLVVGLFADVNSADAKTYLEYAAENDDYPYGIASDKAVYTELGVENDGVVLFKKFDEGRNDFTGDLSVESLKKFVTANSLPLVVEFSHEVISNIHTHLTFN